MLYECKDVMNSKADEEKLHIQIETPDGMPALEADRDKIKQVVLNLLSNAIKYNRPNGSILLRGDFSTSEILIAVQDTGVGIPEDALPHLFQKFYRVRENETKVAGTGLGLSICKQIVQGHGGRMDVKSKIGVGTSFTVRLPRSGKSQPWPDANKRT